MSVPPGVVPTDMKYPVTKMEAGLHTKTSLIPASTAPFAGDVNTELQFGTAVVSTQDTSKSIGINAFAPQLTEPSLSISINTKPDVATTETPVISAKPSPNKSGAVLSVPS